MTIYEMKANIQNGIAWLEENRPGWRPKVKAKIDNGRFNMMFPCDCILGAIDGNYHNALNLLRMNGVPIDVIRHGFALPFTEVEQIADIEYARLTQLWIEAVK